VISRQDACREEAQTVRKSETNCPVRALAGTILIGVHAPTASRYVYKREEGRLTLNLLDMRKLAVAG